MHLLSEFGISIFPLFDKEHQLESVYYPLSKLDAFRHYSKTDTHINDRGSSVILKHLLKGLDIEWCRPQFEETKQLGDLGSIIGYPTENIEKVVSYNNLIPHVTHYSLSSALSGNTGDFDYFLNSNYILPSRVLLFGDSFFKNSISIYSYFFKEVIYLRNPFILTDVANALAPDIIFSGNAERYLATPPKVSCFRPYFANFINGNFDSSKVSNENRIAFHYLLLGRENPDFKNWLHNKRLAIPKNKLRFNNLNTINESDVVTDRDVDFCRDTAVKFEDKNLELSKFLMNIAANKRPDGEFIKQKVYEYKRK